MSWYDGKGRAEREGRKPSRRKPQDYSRGRMEAARSGTYRPASSGMYGSTGASSSGSRAGTSSTYSTGTRGDYGRSGSRSVPVTDPALLPNAVTGLSELDQADAREALTGSREARSIGEVAPELLLKSAEIGSLAIPGGLAVRGAAQLPRAIRAARVALEAGDKVRFSRAVTAAEKLAGDAEKVSDAAKVAARAKKAEKGRRASRGLQKLRDEARYQAHYVASRQGLVPGRALADGAGRVKRLERKAFDAKRAWQFARLTPAYSAVATAKGAEIADWYRDMAALAYRGFTDPEFAEKMRQANRDRSPWERNRINLERMLRRYGDRQEELARGPG